MFERIKDVNHPTEEMLSVFRDYGVIRKSERVNLNSTAENRNIYQLVHPGWLVSNRMKAWQGSVGISSYRGIVSGHYICFAPRHGEDDRYLNHLFRSEAYKDGYGLLSRGVRTGQAEIDNDAYRLMPVVVPPLDEQRAIADYLDRETAQIDALIGKQEQLIETLQERRAAIISQSADGRGQRLARLSLVLQGIKDGTHGSFERTAAGVGQPLLGARNIMKNEVAMDGAESFISERDFLEIVSSGYPRFGDVLLVIVGATIGKSAIYRRDEPLAFQRSVAFLRPRPIVSAAFLWYQIQSLRFRDELALRSKSSAQPGIYLGDVAAIPFFLPNMIEQQRVVNDLDERTAKIDGLIVKVKRLIELAKERRSALITAAVTGQIDVRDQAARSTDQPFSAADLEGISV